MTDIEKNEVDTTPVKAVADEEKKDLGVFSEDDIPEDATWGEVFQTCCVHSFKDWLMILAGACLILLCLYFFLFGLDLLASGAKVMGGCAAGELFGDDTNPVAGVMIGILATVFLQSSSTTTSIVVSLVGAGSVSVNQGIFMVMGANIGTSVTNTIVAMGQMGDGDQLERAFAGATVHDMFNFLTVGVVFPIELFTGYLNRLTSFCVRNFESRDGKLWVGPIKKIVGPLTHKVIVANYKVIKGVAKGESCDDYYPIQCEDPSAPSKSTCSQVGLIACDMKTGVCPLFFQVDATVNDDQVSGIAVFVIGLIILFTCLFAMFFLLQKMLIGTSKSIIYKATNINGYIAILIGAGVTVVIQSSSITTSTFTPLVGLDVVRLEQMFPITVGANIGTTTTAMLAALLSSTQGMQVALAHFFFNLTGIIIWYPLPFMRQVPLNAARNLGRATRIWRGFPIVYIFVCFLLIPTLFLGLSILFTQDAKALTILGSLLTIALFGGIIYTAYWFKFRSGKERIVTCMSNRQTRREAFNDLPSDMQMLKEKIKQLEEHTGLLAADELNEDAEKAEEVVEETA